MPPDDESLLAAARPEDEEDFIDLFEGSTAEDAEINPPDVTNKSLFSALEGSGLIQVLDDYNPVQAALGAWAQRLDQSRYEERETTQSETVHALLQAYFELIEKNQELTRRYDAAYKVVPKKKRTTTRLGTLQDIQPHPDVETAIIAKIDSTVADLTAGMIANPHRRRPLEEALSNARHEHAALLNEEKKDKAAINECKKRLDRLTVELALIPTNDEASRTIQLLERYKRALSANAQLGQAVKELEAMAMSITKTTEPRPAVAYRAVKEDRHTETRPVAEVDMLSAQLAALVQIAQKDGYAFRVHHSQGPRGLAERIGDQARAVLERLLR